jgi:hypothetical protein
VRATTRLSLTQTVHLTLDGQGPMAAEFRVFLSAVTSEFGTARDAVANDLQARPAAPSAAQLPPGAGRGYVAAAIARLYPRLQRRRLRDRRAQRRQPLAGRGGMGHTRGAGPAGIGLGAGGSNDRKAALRIPPEITGFHHAVAATWQTSVDQLTEAGLRLLERLAFLASDPVPMFLLDVAVPEAEAEDHHPALEDLTAVSLLT